MHTVKLNLKERTYNIIVGSNILNRLGKYIIKLGIGADAYVVTNALIKKKYGNALERALRKSGFSVKFKTIPDTEKSKSMEMAASIIKDITCYDKRKRVFILAFGGGVIGDLSGFVASIYKRGVPYIQIPTTLLAQVDSSIGGKTAVDLVEGKNLIGAFYQPRLVLSDVKLLNTLSRRQIRAGLAEVIKYAVIKDRQLFFYLEKKYKDILALKQGALKHIVKRSSNIKAGIVERDEREEKGLRTALNFGHTIGHAIEAASGYKIYNHGEAISLGMLIASDISEALNLINKSTCRRIERIIKAAGLPTAIKRVSVREIINAHYRDKKFIGLKNRFVLIRSIGKTKIVENIPVELIKAQLKKRAQN